VQALKLLTGNVDAIDRSLLSLDAWSNEIRQFDVSNARDGETCPCCGQGKFEHFEGAPASATLSLCGRNAVQISPANEGDTINLAEFAARLSAHGEFTHNAYLMRGELKTEQGANGQPVEITLFPNGRAIIKGVSKPEAARSIYAKYIGA
jgi:adenylyltransferase/sulfurtransferase